MKRVKLLLGLSISYIVYLRKTKAAVYIKPIDLIFQCLMYKAINYCTRLIINYSLTLFCNNKLKYKALSCYRSNSELCCPEMYGRTSN